MKNKIQAFIVDSFTDQPFAGNPAGVCILHHSLSEDEMLLISKELGLSETAFTQQIGNTGSYSIRYFSPKMEIPLCGHATLASAKVLYELNPDTKWIRFVTGTDLELSTSRMGDKITMKFPAYATSPMEVPPSMLSALGIPSIINSVYNKETNILLIEIESAQDLQRLSPDFMALQNSHDSIHGVLITSRSERPDFDFESRYFWPWSGTNEDPVTGGTHTFLTGYWSTLLNKTRMKSFQCSERTGFMEVECIGEDKITITSAARIVFEGALRI